jgi:hypothetical protein
MDDASYDTEQPENPYAPRAERAASLEDQPRRFVMSGLWVVGPDLDEPQDAAKANRPNTFEKIVYGLEFAPILQAGSGFRDDPLVGTYERNTLRTPTQLHFDFRVLRMVPIWRGHLDIVAESFNLLNRQNVEQIDSAFGPELAALPEFRSPVRESDARRVQFSVDYEY